MQIIGDIRDRDWQKAGLVMLAMLLAAVLAFAVAQTRALNAANARIDAMVQKAFYETCELTEGMAVNFRKLLVAGERGQMQALLNETALQTQGAMSDLALLPLGQETVSATLKFINQAGDFVRTLSVKLGNGGALTEHDHETLQTLSETAAGFSVSLARLLDRYEKGEAVFDGALEATGQENLAPITNPAGEYPVLLYDGPFSDGRSDGDFKTLEGLPEVDEPTARQRLTAFLGQQVRDVRLTGEGSVPVDCYEYSLQMGDYRLSAGVTKAGGEVLYLLCDSDVGDVNITQDAAVDAARAFLLARGFGSMEMSYMSLFDGILTVNFAAVQDGVVLYPDLVKVQVSMRDSAVIGLEPAGYLMNHVQRVIEIPRITEEEALARIGSALTAEGARLCVIPENDAEYLCYEISATDGAGSFLVYIDAMTGVERELMQVVTDGSGSFVM
ncbi:MAG: germination protein YpeB [Clostridia bacterium]|nr:germination protein YpeB [Clostridia bacterium]